MTAGVAYEGGCFCGAARYRAVGPATSLTNCHCTLCRRTSAAPFVAWASFRRGDFGFVSDQPAFFESSSHGVRTFCARCGTPLTCELSEHPDWIDITICSLDDPESLVPEDDTWTSSRLSWVQLADGLLRYARSRSEG